MPINFTLQSFGVKVLQFYDPLCKRVIPYDLPHWLIFKFNIVQILISPLEEIVPLQRALLFSPIALITFNTFCPSDTIPL